MNVEDFLQPQKENEVQPVEETTEEGKTVVEDIELDVQKAVVESLAAEKVERDERIFSLEEENTRLVKKNKELETVIAGLKSKLEECEIALSKVGEILARNSDTEASNKIALLDRDVNLPDRFIGETREQVLEAIKEARDKAEAEGRLRRAQILESVMVANVATGELARKRKSLEKFFNDNGNIISGTVIAELEKYGISHKKGEEYLLPSEIIRRTY